MSKEAKRLRRTDLPVSLKGATEFAGDGVTSPHWVVQMAKAHPQFLRDLFVRAPAGGRGVDPATAGSVARSTFSPGQARRWGSTPAGGSASGPTRTT
ncbi:MAG: hypothetical protein JWO74_1928 [Solirubrobacterales bacterium]|nr:hypothetical protein [Solirubrobacterales bacterium]